MLVWLDDEVTWNNHGSRRRAYLGRRISSILSSQKAIFHCHISWRSSWLRSNAWKELLLGKLSCPLKINGLFRCISYWIELVPFRGHVMFRGCTSDYPAASEAISGVLNLLLRRRMLGGSRCRVVIWGKNGNKRSGWFEMDICIYIYVYIYI